MKNNIHNELGQKVHNTLYENIIPFWLTHTIDQENGGFYGRVNNDLTPVKSAPKCLILNTRILWTFSFLFNYQKNSDYLKFAERAYEYFISKFIDTEYGGTYWLLDDLGHVLIDKKKVYGQAFSIYALTEFYKATNGEDVLDKAKQIFHLIEKYHYDREHQGYFETCNNDWSITDEMRLSDTDMNEKKSMNAHLHLMEAYSSLYQVWKDNTLRKRLHELVGLFVDRIIDPQTNHLMLFFDEKWNSKSKVVSFGHDIEASWLLTEAADVLDECSLIEKVRQVSLKLVDATINEGFNNEAGIYSEKQEDGSQSSYTDWWQQAEAVVGLLNAYSVNRDETYLKFAIKAWSYIENYFIDRENGEWFYEVSSDGVPNTERYKVSEWKGPYHNSRACIEILERLKSITWKAVNNKQTG